MDESDTSLGRSTLLAWYDQNQRDLPWRRLQDPWATWVSEVMLQQTRVSSVLEYFDRFLTRFPTPSALAEAEWDEVASLWAGLGYYRRAQNLWKASREVVERHGGEVPSRAEEVHALTGVGPYTAGAILSIAFQQEAPIVDGNVARVFSRLYHIEQEAQSREAQKTFWGLASEWVRGERPGDLNQGLMELGATVCLPQRPTCLFCPVRAYCRATHETDPERLPLKKRRVKQLPQEDHLALLIQRDPPHKSPRYLVRRRGETGLLSGLWGLPHLLRSSDEPLDQAELRALGDVWLSGLTLEDIARLIGSSSDIGETDELISALTSHPSLYLSLHASSPSEPPEDQLSERVEIDHRFTHKRWRWLIAPLSLRVSPEPAGEDALSARSFNLSAHSASRALSSAELSDHDWGWATASELDQLALGGPSLKAFRASGIPLKARRGSGRGAQRSSRSARSSS